MKELTTYHAALPARLAAQVEQLKARGNARGIGYKIDPGTADGITHLRDGQLVGYMTVDRAGGDPAEAAAIADDTACWDAMAAVARQTVALHGGNRLLYIADPEDALITGHLLAMGLPARFTEYRMSLPRAHFAPVPHEGITLRPATTADRRYMDELDLEAFGSQGPAGGTVIEQTYMVVDWGRTVGKLRLDRAGDDCGIYGFIIDPAYRGQGLGSKALSALIPTLEGRVYLEVDSGNPRALHLYKKLGFAVETRFTYYLQSF